MYRPQDFFTEDEMTKIRKLGISIVNNMIPLQYKDFYYTKAGHIWDIDTYQAGACRCLTMDEENFLTYYDTVKLNENVMCSNLELFFRICYDFKVLSFLQLKKVCDFADQIIVCEAGRGVDVMLASLVKPWSRIVAYDQDKAVLYEMRKYFKGELGLPFEDQQLCTINYDFAGINEKTIIFATCHNVGPQKQQEIRENKNLIAILDGEILIA